MEFIFSDHGVNIQIPPYQKQRMLSLTQGLYPRDKMVADNLLIVPYGIRHFRWKDENVLRDVVYCDRYDAFHRQLLQVSKRGLRYS